MRLQHNIEPPPPGRGGNRKRKRDDAEPSPPIASATGGFNTFKVESSTPVEFYIEEGDGRRVISPIEHVRVDYFTTEGQQRTPTPEEESGDEADDVLSARLMATMDPESGLIMGRSPEMVRYLVMKAKHHYALEQHEHLIEELRIARYELSREKEAKEAMLDDFLRATFGYVLHYWVTSAAEPLLTDDPLTAQRLILLSYAYLNLRRPDVDYRALQVGLVLQRCNDLKCLNCKLMILGVDWH
jgi:hypothetical protein